MRRRAPVAWALVLASFALTGPPTLPAQTTERRASARKPARSSELSPEVLQAYYRPTVTIRNGTHRGSGTIVHSARGDTLILTAAHVVAGATRVEIEVHPYNLGIEKDQRKQAGKTWPQLAPAEVVAADPPADVAFVRIREAPAFPYVARVGLEAAEPVRDEILTSVGVVSGTDLTGWRTDVKGPARLDLARATGVGEPGDPRIFTVTTKPPEKGRSGGGLYRRGGILIGVAVGRLRLEDNPEVGVFASVASIRKLAREHDLEEVLNRTPQGRLTTTRSSSP